MTKQVNGRPATSRNAFMSSNQDQVISSHLDCQLVSSQYIPLTFFDI